MSKLCVIDLGALVALPALAFLLRCLCHLPHCNCFDLTFDIFVFHFIWPSLCFQSLSPLPLPLSSSILQFIVIYIYIYLYLSLKSLVDVVCVPSVAFDLCIPSIDLEAQSFLSFSNVLGEKFEIWDKTDTYESRKGATPRVETTNDALQRHFLYFRSCDLEGMLCAFP